MMSEKQYEMDISVNNFFFICVIKFIVILIKLIDTTLRTYYVRQNELNLRSVTLFA